MAHFLVSMDLPEATGPNDSLPSIDNVVGLMRSILLPSLESLLRLKAQGKIVAGGFPSEQGQSLILIMKAEAEEEVLEALQTLPCWTAAANTEVTRLHVLEELSSE